MAAFSVQVKIPQMPGSILQLFNKQTWALVFRIFFSPAVCWRYAWSKTKQVPHLCASLKPHSSSPCYSSGRGCVAHRKALLLISFFTQFRTTFRWQEWCLWAVESGKVTAPCWGCKEEWCPWVYNMPSPKGLGLILEIGLLLQNMYIAIIILWSWAVSPSAFLETVLQNQSKCGIPPSAKSSSW